MNLLEKIFTSSLWLLIINTVGRCTMFFINIFVARMLSQEAFSQFSMIRNRIASV